MQCLAVELTPKRSQLDPLSYVQNLHSGFEKGIQGACLDD